MQANKDGTWQEQAQYWLEKAVSLEASGNASQAEMAFKMALKREAEGNGTTYTERRA